VVSSPKKAGLPRIPPAQPVHQQRMGPIPLHPFLADFMDRVRAAVDRRLPPGEAVWTAPAAPGWSFVLDRPPAHPLSISYVTTSDAERERIRRELAEAPPRLILRQADRSSFEGVPMRTYLGVAADRVDAHYRVDETLRVGEHVVEILVPR
jgi:hypothetical protein